MGVLEGLIAERRQQVIIDSGWLYSLMLRGFPLDNYNSKTMKYSRYSRVRRKNMRCTKMECDTVYFCKGFQNSKGCMAEFEIARIYGKQIIFEY